MADTLEKKLKEKLEAGEIDQEEYDNLMGKFSDLDLLSAKVGKSKKQNYSYSGSRTIEGGDISEPIKVSGRMRSTGSLTCPKMIVSGSAVVDGELKVTDAVKISGSLVVEKDLSIGGTFSLSGKSSVGASTKLGSESRISGKMEVNKQLMTDAPLKVSGKLKANSILSTSDILLSGKIYTDADVEANSFKTSGGASNVGGSLKAPIVEIAKKYRENYQDGDSTLNTDDTDFSDPGELGEFISNMVTKFIPNLVNNVVGNVVRGSGGPPSTFVINQNIEGKTVDISYTHVKGDIIAENVFIGPGVVVDGAIKYKNSFTALEGTDYTTEKY